MKTQFIILLGVLSLGLFNVYPRYFPIGPELLRNSQLRTLTAWRGSKQGVQLPDTGGALLFADDGNGMIALGQRVGMEASGLLLFSCEIKSENVVNGKQDWETARVVLISHDRAGQALYNRPHVLANLQGSHDWRRVEKAFVIDEQVREVEAAAQLVRSSGAFSVRDFSLRPVMLKTEFLQYRWLLLAGWLFAGVWLGLPLLLASLRSRQHAIVLLLVAGIVLGVCLPHDVKTLLGDALWPVKPKMEDGVGRLALDAQFFNTLIGLPKLDVFKIGHFLLFALLAMTFASSKPYRLSLATMLGYLVLLATTSELLQLFIPGRSSQLTDILLDLTGALCGLLLFALGRLCWRVKRLGNCK